jgi:adenylate cyclase
LIDTGRRLVAIFAADVEGYSRLMGTDEIESLRDLTLRRQLLDELIASDRGWIANTAGYGVLDESGNADAIQRAVEAREALAEANAGAPPDRHMNFRIGAINSDWFLTSRPPKRSIAPCRLRCSPAPKR